MAHGILFNEATGKFDMAYVDEVPWHQLGQRLSPGSPLEVWAKESGMDFQIEEAPVMYFDEMAVDEEDGTQGALTVFPGRKALIRSDSRLPLSIMSSNYKIVQPKEILEFYRDLIDAGGFQMETAGVLFGGKKFWALAKINEQAKICGVDDMEGYLLLATACDGSLATTAQFTSTRVVCNNTLTFAIERPEYGDVGVEDEDGVKGVIKRHIKIPHHATFNPDTVKAQMGLAGDAWKQFVDDSTKLAKTKITDAEALEFIISILGEKGISPDEQPKAVRGALALYLGEGKGSSLKTAKNTLWGAVNSITEYVDHCLPAKSLDTHINRAWFGDGEQAKNRAFIEALKMAA